MNRFERAAVLIARVMQKSASGAMRTTLDINSALLTKCK